MLYIFIRFGAIAVFGRIIATHSLQLCQQIAALLWAAISPNMKLPMKTSVLEGDLQPQISGVDLDVC